MRCDGWGGVAYRSAQHARTCIFGMPGLVSECIFSCIFCVSGFRDGLRRVFFSYRILYFFRIDTPGNTKGATRFVQPIFGVFFLYYFVYFLRIILRIILRIDRAVTQGASTPIVSQIADHGRPKTDPEGPQGPRAPNLAPPIWRSGLGPRRSLPEPPPESPRPPPAPTPDAGPHEIQAPTPTSSPSMCFWTRGAPCWGAQEIFGKTAVRRGGRRVRGRRPSTPRVPVSRGAWLGHRGLCGTRARARQLRSQMFAAIGALRQSSWVGQFMPPGIQGFRAEA